MSAAAEWPITPLEQKPQAPAVAAVTESLTTTFGHRFLSAAPLWLRTDPSRAVWLAAPIAVLVVATPQPLMRPVLAVVVAVGVALTLQWQTALQAHQDRASEFVQYVAHAVAVQMVTELPPEVLTEVAGGHYRPALQKPIMSSAQKAAAKRRGRRL